MAGNLAMLTILEKRDFSKTNVLCSMTAFEKHAPTSRLFCSNVLDRLPGKAAHTVDQKTGVRVEG